MKCCLYSFCFVECVLFFHCSYSSHDVDAMSFDFRNLGIYIGVYDKLWVCIFVCSIVLNCVENHYFLIDYDVYIFGVHDKMEIYGFVCNIDLNGSKIHYFLNDYND